MQRAPALIAFAVLAMSVALALHLAGGRSPFSPGSGVVLGTGFILYAVIAVGGLLLSRGRWVRRLAAGLAAAGLLAASLTAPWSAAAIVAIILSAVALIGLTGRWLDGWLRLRPSAEGPGTRVIVLVLGLVGLVPAVALASPAGLSTFHGALGGAGVLLAWRYSRAEVWALWSVRTWLPIIAIPALLRTSAPGAAFLAAVVGAIVWVAWSREALLAVQPLLDELPGPRIIGGREPSS